MRCQTRGLIRGGGLLLVAMSVAGCFVQTKGGAAPKAETTEAKPVAKEPAPPVVAKIEKEAVPPLGTKIEKVPPVAEPKAAPTTPAAEGGDWGTVKGRVVWGGDKDPEVKDIVVGAAHAGCLMGNPVADNVKGTIPEENYLVNAKNKGLKNVFVYFVVLPGEKIAINPNLQKFAPEMVIDQPHCMFWPRALALREGQVFVVKNSSQIQHNIRWIGDDAINKGGSIIINPGDKHEVKDLKSQRLPLALECNIHGWMKGRLGVFSHPYYTITDDDGKFEIKDAPVGNHKLMIYHEEIGYRLGAKGKNGEDIAITPAGLDLKELKMGKN
jgi:hypothetical protein